MDKKTELNGLALLRMPFPAHQVSKLPKPTKAQTDEVKQNFKAGIRCTICGTWHHPKVVHLDYVGHAALTDRLLDSDVNWSWEPLALGQDGLPLLDKDGGMWIKLTVCGITRLGYGDAQGKTGPDAMKERIGDALRNAAMRFGAALDLWHKGDLHLDDELGGEEAANNPAAKHEPKVQTPIGMTPTGLADLMAKMDEADTLEKLKEEYANAYKLAKTAGDVDSMGKFEVHYKRLKEKVAV